MAKAKLSYTRSSSSLLLLLLLLLIVCAEITSTQGRAVMDMSRSGKCKKCSGTHQAIKAAAMIRSPSKEIDDEAEDYRPTTPGHSPGVGHATGPSSIGPDV